MIPFQLKWFVGNKEYTLEYVYLNGHIGFNVTKEQQKHVKVPIPEVYSYWKISQESE